MAKINLVIKSIFAVLVSTNSLHILIQLGLVEALSQQRQRKYPSCPRCNKSTFLHHDYEHYSNYRCSDKKCNHSFFVPKPNAVSSASMSRLFGKTNFILKMISLTTLLNALTSNLRIGTKTNMDLTLMNLLTI
jgi:ribosomal protein S27AE